MTGGFVVEESRDDEAYQDFIARQDVEQSKPCQYRKEKVCDCGGLVDCLEVA